MKISAHSIGILYALTAFFMVALGHLLVKGLGQSLPLAEVMAFRFAIGLMFLYPAIRRQGGWRHTLQTPNPKGMIYRAILGLGWISMTFYALRFLPVAPATAIWASAPLLVAALSAPVLGEKINAAQWAAILLGITGVIFICRPISFGTDNYWAVVIMVIASLAAALSNLQVRKLTFSNKSLTIVTWYFLIALLPCLIITATQFVMPNLLQLTLLAGIGISGSIMLILNTQAYRYLPAATVAIYEYTVIIWTAIFGWIIFSEKLTWQTMTGACLIVLGGLLVKRFRTTENK